MTALRKLSVKEIEEFAGREGVNRTTVERFLMLVHNNETRLIAEKNLELDTRFYKLNEETIKAIQDGIIKAEIPFGR